MAPRKRRVTYTIITDAAIKQIHEAIDVIVTDMGTTGEEKQKILDDLRSAVTGWIDEWK